ncbi:MAG: hypothetical protein K2O03_14360, partial [Lachnospiraceae bacterium]|nr:hypothetical protein [Lachnospiraceae bacterium]
MKKQRRKIQIALLFAALLFVIHPAGALLASQATSYTYTLDDNDDFVRTQDAYLPERTITDLGLKTPQDLFVDKANMLYIADSGNRRIVKYDIY